MNIMTLAGGLSNVKGTSFVSAQNRLVFVEGGTPLSIVPDGKLSYLDLRPRFVVISSGTETIPITFGFDFDAGSLANPGQDPNCDVMWAAQTAIKRQLGTISGATIVNLGVIPFASLQPTELVSLRYATTPINGSDDATNELVTGDVFAVHTSNGNFTKVQVTTYGADLQIQWATYGRVLQKPSVVSQGAGQINGTYLFDFDAGSMTQDMASADVEWVADSDTELRLVPCSWNGASIVNLGAVPFATLEAGALLGLRYDTTALNGYSGATNQLPTGDVFAVHTTGGNFAKVLVTSYGYYLQIQWVTYRIYQEYGVLGSGYGHPSDVKVTADGRCAYMTEGGGQNGKLLKIDLRHPFGHGTTVVSSGMVSPQQLVLDEDAGTAYVVECAASGRLLQIDLASGAQTVCQDGLSYAVGLVETAPTQFYISEQTADPNKGRLTWFAWPSLISSVVADNLHKPGFLAWAHPLRDSLYVVEGHGQSPMLAREPTILEIQVPSGPTSTKATVASWGSPPFSVAPIDSRIVLVCGGSAVGVAA